MKGMMLRSATAVGIVLSVGGRASAEPRTHDGFQFRGASGLGYLADSEQPDGSSTSGNIHGVAGSFEAFFGGTLASGLSLGGFFGAVFAPGPSVSVNGNDIGTASSSASLDLFTIGPYIDFYPDPHGGFHALATVGFADLNASNGSRSSNSATGFG